ncbi:hypothetical protein J1N35_044448 [Gossypium stocksii]|uniref:Uncharacterized protein n=1 Tax=Gossypium stocksii TaxID=47602 RepID=A0A9D3U994_9ROSI|nr:hypothetical protein J1N35_044448 [Gossypium stocksii]
MAKVLLYNDLCHDNLVFALYSSAKLVHDSTSCKVISIKSYLMGTEIKIDINTISTHLDTPNADDREINGEIPPFIQPYGDNIGSLELHDHFLQLINSKKIKSTHKHARIHLMDYWIIHCIQTKHKLNLSSIIFLYMIGVIKRPSSTIFSLKYNTLLPILFHKLGINVDIDPAHEVQQAKEDDKVTQHATLTSSHTYVVFKSFWVTFNEIHAHFDAQFDSFAESFECQMYALEDNMVALMSHFPPPPIDD